MSAALRARIALLASALVIACGRKQPLPALPTFSAAEVQAALHRAPGVAAQAPCKFEKWKQQPGAMIALCAPMTGSSTAPIGPHVVLVEPHADRLEVVASGQLALAKTRCDLASGDPRPSDEAPTFALDHAAYALAPANTAVGVRFSCHNEFPSGEGSETRLYLFERSGAALRQIFDQPIEWTNEDRAGGTESSGHADMIIQSASHDGHHDILLSTTTSSHSLGTGSAAPSAESVRSSKQQFVWAHDHYAAPPEK